MYGLVLEGGGAKGAYHIGAYKALLEEGVEIKGVAGTSVGALNGAMLVQGDYEKAYEMWYDMSYSKVINASDEEINKLKQGKLSKEDIYLLTEKIRGVLSDKGLDVTPLKNLLTELVDEDRVRNSGKDFGIVTVSLSDLKPLEIYIEDIPAGKLVEFLMASAYFPAFKREKIDGKRYIDGGLYNNLPVNLLKDKGYQDLVLIRTHGVGNVRKFDLEGLNTITIAPNEDLGKTLDFECSTARKNLELGYYDGLKALRGLKGYRYYIEGTKDEVYFMNYLWNLEEDRVLKLGKLFRIEENIPYKRALFELMIPKLSSLLGVGKEATYGDVFYSLIERLAEIYEIERFNIYSDAQLLEIINENLKAEVYPEIGVVDKIIEKVDLLSLFNREEVFKQISRIIFNIF